jgi:hypothetical protein
MSESSEEHRPKEDSGTEDHGAADAIGGEGGEGAENAEATPEISEEGEHGQTQAPAPDDDAEEGSERNE